MRLKDHKVLTFDCYGTLVDWETGIIKGLAPLAERSGRALSADEILETHAHFEAFQQRSTPGLAYSRLLAAVHRRIAEEWDAPADWDESLAYGNSVGDWPVFDDTAAALSALKQRFKLVILSNVDNRSFAKSSRKLGISFDAVYTAEDIGSYKPSLRNFTYMLDHLGRRGFKSCDILHVAESLFHDHVPAGRLGLDSCWIHRRKGKKGFGAARAPDAAPKTDFVFGSLQEFADACAAEDQRFR